MKKRIFALFCALLMLTGLVSIAGAESTASTLPIKVELDFSKYQFTAPEEITVTIRVTNVRDEKFTSPVSVLDPTAASSRRSARRCWTRVRARAARLRGT